MDQITLYHNTSCATSRHVLDAVTAVGAKVQVVQYLKAPLSREQLLDLIGILEDPPEDLVRKDPFFASQGLRAQDYRTPEQVAEVLVRWRLTCRAGGAGQVQRLRRVAGRRPGRCRPSAARNRFSP